MAILRDPSSQKLFLDGRLEGIGPPELIHRICLPGRTGTLTLSRGELCKKVYVNAGRLIFASSNFAEDRLGETLLRAGMIGYREFDEASRLLANGKRLGAILVELGYLSPENLVRGVLEHVKEIILDLFAWEYGAYRFVEGALPSPEVITLAISTPRIIFEGIHRITGWPRIAAGVGSPRTILRLTRDGRRIAEGLELGAAEGLILDMLEEPTSVGAICRSVFLPNFEVYQALWAFRILGILRDVAIDVDRSAPPDPSGRKGNLGDVAVGQLLLRLCRDGETGILYLTRGGEEKALHIRSGTVVFATSNRSEDNLTSFLLRRGVIGLRDRDEVERRLLSNKRAGTILREMGILSHDELVRFVREQLREIILSAFQWEGGEWRFVSGQLPTLEGITLDRPVEEWVLHGVRRVRDWARIRQGCGDLDTVLRPVESPSAALAGVELGPEEGEVLAAVQVPRTVSGICQSVRLSDYRVGQILWALQMIGAIARAPVEALVPPPERLASPAPLRDAAATAPELFGSAEGTQASSSAATPAVTEQADASEQITPSLGRPSSPADIHPGWWTIAAALASDPAGPEPAPTTVPRPSEMIAGSSSESVSISEQVPREHAEISEHPDPRTAELAGIATTPAADPDETISAYRGIATMRDPAREESVTAAPATAFLEDGPSTVVPLALEERATELIKGGDASPADTVALPIAAILARARVEAAVVVTNERGEEEGCSGEDFARATPAEAVRAGGTSEAGGVPTNAASHVETPAGPPEEAEVGKTSTGRPMPPAASRRVGMLKEIERFNNHHREVFSILKGAVGARAKNTVANCIKRLGETGPVFSGLAPDDAGHFPAGDLFERLKETTRKEARSALESLIRTESGFVAQFLDARGTKRFDALLSALSNDAVSGSIPESANAEEAVLQPVGTD